MSKAIWKTQDGREVAVADMDNRHLINTIAMLERNAESYKQHLLADAYATAGIVQGEQAEYDIYRDIDRLEDMTPQEFLEEFVPVYKSMKWHAARRKLANLKDGENHE